MIGTIVIPTPKIIKKRFKRIIKKYGTEERVLIYTLISGSIVIASTTDIPAKSFVLGSLIYSGIAFEVLEKWYAKVEDDAELKKLFLKYNFFI